MRCKQEGQAMLMLCSAGHLWWGTIFLRLVRCDLLLSYL